MAAHTQKPAWPDKLLLGQALVAEGHLSQAQLATVVAAKARHPHFAVGQLATILYNVPVETVDEICLRRVILPLFPDELQRRLRVLAQRDKFAQGLDPDRFVTGIGALARRFETQSVAAHTYERTSQQAMRTTIRRFVVTEAAVDAELDTTAGSVAGSVHIRHHSEIRALLILDTDDRLLSTLYYDLKALYLKSCREAI